MVVLNSFSIKLCILCFYLTDSSDQPQISPSEEAILDCMMSGGGYLSLKAHFITELPDLSPLSRTLTYLNISFNSLNVNDVYKVLLVN